MLLLSRKNLSPLPTINNVFCFSRIFLIKLSTKQFAKFFHVKLFWVLIFFENVLAAGFGVFFSTILYPDFFPPGHVWCLCPSQTREVLDKGCNPFQIVIGSQNINPRRLVLFNKKIHVVIAHCIVQLMPSPPLRNVVFYQRKTTKNVDGPTEIQRGF